MVVSSAYDNKFRDVQWLMSFMYRRNRIGPRIPYITNIATERYELYFYTFTRNWSLQRSGFVI